MSHIPQMHPCRAVAQIFFIFSILYLVLAAPIVVQEIHGARKDKMVVAEDAAIKLALDRTMSPRSPPGSEPSPPHSPPSGDPFSWSDWNLPDFPSWYTWELDSQPPGPELSHDSASLPHLSPSSIELPSNLGELAPEIPPSPRPQALDYVDWLFGPVAPVQVMPPPPHPPASLYNSESPTSSESSEITEMTLPERLQEFASSPERPPPPPPLPAGSASPASPQHAGSSSELPEVSLPEWLQKFEKLGFRE